MTDVWHQARFSCDRRNQSFLCMLRGSVRPMAPSANCHWKAEIAFCVAAVLTIEQGLLRFVVMLG